MDLGLEGVGGLVGYNAQNGVIENVSNSATVNLVPYPGDDNMTISDIVVGGIAGISDGEIIAAVNHGKIGDSTTTYTAGGIAGSASGTLEKVMNDGEIPASENAGGIVGCVGGELSVEAALNDSFCDLIGTADSTAINITATATAGDKIISDESNVSYNEVYFTGDDGKAVPAGNQSESIGWIDAQTAMNATYGEEVFSGATETEMPSIAEIGFVE